MPPKIRELIINSRKQAIVNRGGKESNWNYVPPEVSKPITISGKSRDDAKIYLLKAVKKAIEDSKK